MRAIGRGTVLAVLLMGAMALAQPEPEQPAAKAAQAEAGAPAPAPSPAPVAPATSADAGAEPPAPPPKPQSAAEPAAPPPAPRAQAAPAPPAQPPPAPPAQAPAFPPLLLDRARTFFTALLAGEPGPLVAQAKLPFYLEDRRITSQEQLKAEWLNQLRSKRTDLLSLKGFEVLTPEEMEKRFGKPPARLSGWPLRSGKSFLVVANVSGRAAVALYQAVGDDWRIVAYHD